MFRCADDATKTEVKQALINAVGEDQSQEEWAIRMLTPKKSI